MIENLSLSPVVAGVMNWGSWGAKLGKIAMAQLIEQCVDAGVTSFDHADIYGGYTTEAEFGDAWSSTSVPRDQIQLVSKCGIKYPCDTRPDFKIKSYDTSAKYIKAQVDRTLKNLKTDYLDLLLIHRPSPLMRFEEMARAIDELKLSGKIRHFGVSNFSSQQFDLLHSYTPLAANQIELSLLHTTPMTDGTLDSCQRYGAVPMAWSPLGGGRLFGMAKKADFVLKRSRLKALADQWGMQLDELGYVFLHHHPASVVAVTGSSKIERIRLALTTKEISITDEQWFKIWEAIHDQPVP